MRRGTSVSVTVTGVGFAAGARLTFLYGTGPQPLASNVVVAANGQSLTATVTAGTSSLASALPWDVVVTNPDGRTGRKYDAFVVQP
jgi:hypothetical protein